MAQVTKGFVSRPKLIEARISSSINRIYKTMHLSFKATDDESETLQPKRLRVILSEEETNDLIRFWNDCNKDPKE